ncbi:MAG: DUF5660 family protein [Patescibacteria group bacterium]
MTDQKKKQIQSVAKQNVIESLKGIGTSVGNDFFNDLLGFKGSPRKISAEIAAGESMDINESFSASFEENKKLKAQILLERNLSSDEKRLSEEKIGKLRVQLQALISEIAKLAFSNQELAQESKIAMMEVPVNPGIYHIVFFEKLISFMQSFRKKIEEAGIWLHSSNKRSEKKNYWSMYKKKGSSFLLSPDHYLQRSAG